MMSQSDKARLFRDLHIPSDPVILYNIWDAGSAASVARAGAKAIATGSWSVAAAQGYSDGEQLPLDDALAVVARIAATIDQLPVTVDFEGGYSGDPKIVGQNVRRLLELGVVGLNFEDQVVNGDGLYSIADQAARLRAVRQAADAMNIPAFINARTDVFLKAAPDTHAGLMDDAVARCAAYAEAGADGFFVPGLTDKALIRQVCEASALPVNVMMTDNLTGSRDMAALGVARISLGPAPYIGFSTTLEQEARAFY